MVTAGQGWGQPRVLELVAASAALLVVFWRIEAAADRPMLDPRLWRRPVFVAATLAALFTGLSVIGLMSYLPTVLERVIGLTPWATSQLFALWAGTSFVATMLARRRGFGLHGHRSVVVGLAVSAAGDLALWGLTRSAGVWHLIPGLVVSGVGYGLLNAVIGRLALESVPDRGSTGSGVNNATRYIGSGIGVTLLMAVSRPSVGPAATMVHDPNLALVIGAAIAVLGAVSIATVRDTPQSVVLAAQAQAPND
ncbi:MAG: MFS transporter [Thermaerobacter sp.]|nr:MFS transporter [Thermaerobacter sp.]